MSNSDKVVEYLKYKEDNICDDCLSEVLNIKPRQQINQICNKLMKINLLTRMKSECKRCKSLKNINKFNYFKEKIQNKNVETKIIKCVKSEKESIKIDTHKILPIKEVQLKFLDTEIDNIFSKYDKYLLKDILQKPKYKKLSEYISSKYSNYLNNNLSEFLIKMKERNILDYKLFLNPYGDLKYCSFKVIDEDLNNSKGIYLYKIESKIVYIGRCLDNFAKRFNYGYANINPKNCYLDGQSTNCRINNLINDNRANIKLFILKMDDNEKIKNLETELINKYKPEWNIQGV